MRIHHPRPELGKQVMSDVVFCDGVAEVESLHPERELALIQHGASIELVGTPLADSTREELLADARELGIVVSSRARKADIIAAICASPLVPVLYASDEA